MHRPDEGERHVKRNDGYEEEIARGKDSGEHGGERDEGLSCGGEQDGESNESEGNEEGSTETVGVDERGCGAMLVGGGGGWCG